MRPPPVPRRFERSPLVESGLEALDLDALREFLERRFGRTWDESELEAAATSVGLMGQAGANRVPTVLGMLLFGVHPQLLHPEWGVSAIRVAGLSLSDPIELREDFEGPLPKLVEQCMHFVEGNTRALMGQVDPQHREPEYPLPAVREALLNALIHRDLHLPSRVAVRVFDDRLEVWSPGASPLGLGNLEEIAQEGGISMPRNPLLAASARVLGIGEQVGRGLPTIMGGRDKSDPSVDFVETKVDVLVVLRSWGGPGQSLS